MATAIERTSDSSRAIVLALRDRLQATVARRDDQLDEHVSQHWISWRSRRGIRIFAEIRPLRERVQIFLLPSPRNLRDLSGLARRAPRTQGWGWFRTRIELRSLREVKSAAMLVQQSYEQGLRPNGRRRRGGRRGRAAS